jgi:hypothetical protein
MTVNINKVPRSDLTGLISSHIAPTLDAIQLRKFQQFVLVSQAIWSCVIEGEFIGMWGTIPPTLLSDHTYLWVYTNEKVSGHSFVFIRHSQIAIAEVLKEWPIVHGHAVVGANKSIRWLKWLGAEFFEPEGNLIPFVIRRKDG